MPSEYSPSSSRPPAGYRPKLPLPVSDLQLLPVYLTGEVPALSRRTFVSQHITWPFTIAQAQIHFPAGCDNLCLCYLFLSPDDQAPTTGLPTGLNLLSAFAPTPYIAADDITLDFQLSMTHKQKGAWLKLHASNLDGASHYPSALFTIREYQEEP